MAAVRGRDAAARAAAESGAHAHPSARHPPLRPAAAGGDHRRVGAAARVRVLRAGFRPCVRPDDAGGDAVSVYAVVSHRGAARELHRAQAHHAGLLVLDGRRGAGARRDGRAAGAQPDLPPRQRGEIIAIVYRKDDIEEKWVVVPDGVTFSKEEIRRQIHFQEQYFDSEIVM